MQQKGLDRIKIEDLEVFARHGVFREEKKLGQKFLVTAVLYTDTRRAGMTDELTASIHYGEVSAFIDEYLRSHTFATLWRDGPGGFPERMSGTSDPSPSGRTSGGDPSDRERGEKRADREMGPPHAGPGYYFL